MNTSTTSIATPMTIPPVHGDAVVRLMLACVTGVSMKIGNSSVESRTTASERGHGLTIQTTMIATVIGEARVGTSRGDGVRALNTNPTLQSAHASALLHLVHLFRAPDQRRVLKIAPPDSLQ